MVVYFADHLAHSIQVDAIGRRVEHDTLTVGRAGSAARNTPHPPHRHGRCRWSPDTPGTCRPCTRNGCCPWSAGITCGCGCGSGSVNTSSPAPSWAGCGPPTADTKAQDAELFRHGLDTAVRVGFERTLEQDAAFGIRQLVDMACKALSPAVNDPYTAVQAVDHLSVIFCALAVRPLGDYVAVDPGRDGDGHRARPTFRRLSGHHVRVDPPLRLR